MCAVLCVADTTRRARQDTSNKGKLLGTEDGGAVVLEHFVDDVVDFHRTAQRSQTPQRVLLLAKWEQKHNNTEVF
jgi:hypothetical protein